MDDVNRTKGGGEDCGMMNGNDERDAISSNTSLKIDKFNLKSRNF